jgi:hypothetical protein
MHLSEWISRDRGIKIVLLQEGKKKFEKQTAKFCLSQERYLNLSTKKQDAVLKEVSTPAWQMCSQSVPFRISPTALRICYLPLKYVWKWTSYVYVRDTDSYPLQRIVLYSVVWISTAV